ncbi:hypothetical protein [Hydrogenophaga sp. NFH-34]|uniref:hypothetical protein n=1 Tax=Hydrogenophaga sp. NFH-34 TaxID=2744446 RepID=UPI001F2B8720|nr:hypothetical protein [Hydrogenophaga sp. NFH-34]
MKIVANLKRWWKLGWTGFWGERHVFYKTLARSLEKKELLRDFVDGEYAIAMDERTRDRAKASGLRYMREVMSRGVTTIAEVLQAVMPEQDRMALSILGESKDQVAALYHLSAAIEEQNAMKKVVRMALFTPIFLIPVGFAFAYMLTTSTIPAFVESAPEEVWVGFNAFFRSFAEGFSKYGLYVFAFLTAMTVFVLYWCLPNLTASWRYKAEKAQGIKKLGWTLAMPYRPVFGLYRDIQGTRMLTDLSFMLQSGRILRDAVETLATSAQPWMRKHLLVILTHMQEMPGQYVQAFSHGVLSPFLAGYMQSLNRVDSEARFDKVLVEIATRGMNDAREAVRKTAFKLNFWLLALIMGLILFLYGGQAFVVMAIQEANQPAAIMKREAARRKAAEQQQFQSSTPRSVTSTSE